MKGEKFSFEKYFHGFPLDRYERGVAAEAYRFFLQAHNDWQKHMDVYKAMEGADVADRRSVLLEAEEAREGIYKAQGMILALRFRHVYDDKATDGDAFSPSDHAMYTMVEDGVTYGDIYQVE